MLSIQEFIQQHILLPRLKHWGILVVYDPDTRYREICLELASDTLRVIAQGLSGEEGQQAYGPFAAARAQGVPSGVKLGEDEEDLMHDGHLIDVGGRLLRLVEVPASVRQE